MRKFLVLVFLLGCAADAGVEPIEQNDVEATQEGVDGNLAAGTIRYSTLNSTVNGVLQSMSPAIRLNACLRAVVRTFNTSGHNWECNNASSFCINQYDSRYIIWLRDCKSFLGSSNVEICNIIQQSNIIGSCIWNKSATPWVTGGTFTDGRGFNGNPSYTEVYTN